MDRSVQTSGHGRVVELERLNAISAYPVSICNPTSGGVEMNGSFPMCYYSLPRPPLHASSLWRHARGVPCIMHSRGLLTTRVDAQWNACMLTYERNGCVDATIHHFTYIANSTPRLIHSLQPMCGCIHFTSSFLAALLLPWMRSSTPWWMVS